MVTAPRQPDIPEWLRESYPFHTRTLQLGAYRMSFVDEGPADAPAFLLLHGNPTWSFLYRDVIKQLGSEVRSLAPDYPGFGLSDHPKGYGYTPPEHADWVGAWLRGLELPPFVLVVQDWGGPIGRKSERLLPDPPGW